MKSKMKENGSRMGENTNSEDNPGSEESMSGEDGEDYEDEEDDGFEDQDDNNQNNKREMNDQGGKQAKSARTESVDGNLYRPPTVDELSSLRETQLLYHSNLFRMQMDEVLGEVSIKDKTRRQLQEWLARFTTFVTDLPKSNQYQLSDNKWMSESGVCDPTPKGMSGVKGSFVFSPPTKVEFVGSFPANMTTNLSKTVDVMVTLPKECVHNRDWHNGGWLARRIKYGAWLAGRLQDQTDLVAGLSWTYHLGLPARPTLQITPSGSLGKKWSVNIFPVPPPEYCKVSRISPEKNKVEPGWFFNDDTKVDTEAATPQHNWWCGVDVVMREHSKLVHESLSRHSNLAQGVKLIKIWLAQRKLDKGVGCFSGHMVTMLVLHLLQTRKINPQMSAYQIFRNSMVALNCADWSVSGPNMGTFTEAEGPPTEVFHKLYEVVFVDPSGTVNLAATLTSPDYLRIKHEAALAISFLDSTVTDCFDSLFIKKVEMFQLSDQIISIKLKAKDEQRILDRLDSPQEQLMDSLGDPSRLVWSKVVQGLVKGLGERAALVAPLRTPTETWSIQDSPPEQRHSLALGFVLNSYAAWALLTKGPAADSPEAKQFKEFWGEKCSLRRFQDGSFHEAVLWGDPKDSIAQRRLFPEKICREILQEHFGIGKKTSAFCGPADRSYSSPF